MEFLRTALSAGLYALGVVIVWGIALLALVAVITLARVILAGPRPPGLWGETPPKTPRLVKGGGQ